MENKAKKQFIFLMRALSVVYLLVGLIFFFLPTELIYVINIVPVVFKLFSSMAAPVNRFWISLTLSMMMMLSLTAFFSSQKPDEKNYIILHLVSKAVSVFGFLYSFIILDRYWAYMLGALTDGSIFLIVLLATIRLKAKAQNAYR